MKYNLVLLVGIALLISFSAVALADEVVSPKLDSVRVVNNHGQQCIASVDTNNCPRVSCFGSSYSDSNCPPSYINNPTVFINATPDKPCLRFGYLDDYNNGMSKEVCLGTVVTFGSDNNFFCTAYITNSSCAESYCNIGQTHDYLCPTQGSQCHIENDLTHNCLSLVCGTQTKQMCIDQIISEYVSTPTVSENRTVMMRNPRTVIDSVTNGYYAFYGLNVRTGVLSEYFQSIGDSVNATKYRTVSQISGEMAGMFLTLRNKIVQITASVTDMNDISQADRSDIMNSVNAIKTRFDQLKQVIYG